MAEVKATVVIDFGAGIDTSSLLRVELDNYLNVDENGDEKTSFAAGDEVFVAVHKLDSRASVVKIEATSGWIYLVQTGAVRTRSDNGLLFYEGNSVELGYVPDSNPSFSWFGPPPSSINVNGRSVTVTDMPKIGNATYNILADIYRYVPPASITFIEDQFLVGIGITGELS